MSDQGDGGYDGGYGAGATGADAFGADEGVDQGYLGAPESDGFDRIHARMDEMSEQQRAIVEALQTPYDEYEDGDDYEYEDGDLDQTVEEIAAALGVSPEEVLALAEQQQEPDIFELIDRSVDRRFAAEDAEEAIEERDFDFQDLRDQLPILQDEQTCRAIVNRAHDLALAWDPSLIQGPEFVDLIKLVAQAAIGDRAVGAEQPAGIPRVQLESGQGAQHHTPPPTGDEYWGGRIVAAAQRLRPQI